MSHGLKLAREESRSRHTAASLCAGTLDVRGVCWKLQELIEQGPALAAATVAVSIATVIEDGEDPGVNAGSIRNVGHLIGQIKPGWQGDQIWASRVQGALRSMGYRIPHDPPSDSTYREAREAADREWRNEGKALIEALKGTL